MNKPTRHSIRCRLSLLAGSSIILAAAPLLAAATQAASIPAALVEQKVTASDGATNSYFGSAVALHNSTALIGADGENNFQGAAYFFSKSGGAWTEGQKITASDGLGGDEFGYRVALSGDTAVVTAFSATVNGVTSQGAAYVYTRSAGSWIESQKLLASDGALFDNFGASVALDGDTLVIGANGATVNGNPAQGAVYVFTRSNGVWTQTAKLIARDGAAYDNFGLSVALSGNTVLAGAPAAAVNDNSGQGAAYAYSSAAGHWRFAQKLTAPDGAAGDGFGESLAFNGATAIAGAYNAAAGGHSGAGAAYVFSDNAGTFQFAQKLTASDPADFANFGNAVALDRNRALIGADVSPVGDHTSQGKVYLFKAPNLRFRQQLVLTASDGQTDDFFGAALALNRDTILISTPHPTIDGHMYQGAAYFYSQQPQ